jgi:hypothetical protein
MYARMHARTCTHTQTHTRTHIHWTAVWFLFGVINMQFKIHKSLWLQKSAHMYTKFHLLPGPYCIHDIPQNFCKCVQKHLFKTVQYISHFTIPNVFLMNAVIWYTSSWSVMVNVQAEFQALALYRDCLPLHALGKQLGGPHSVTVTRLYITLYWNIPHLNLSNFT